MSAPIAHAEEEEDQRGYHTSEEEDAREEPPVAPAEEDRYTTDEDAREEVTKEASGVEQCRKIYDIVVSQKGDPIRKQHLTKLALDELAPRWWEAEKDDKETMKRSVDTKIRYLVAKKGYLSFKEGTSQLVLGPVPFPVNEEDVKAAFKGIKSINTKRGKRKADACGTRIEAKVARIPARTVTDFERALSAYGRSFLSNVSETMPSITEKERARLLGEALAVCAYKLME